MEKKKPRKGMNYYLRAHLEYKGTLINKVLGYDVVVIQYDTLAKGIRPQAKKAHYTKLPNFRSARD